MENRKYKFRAIIFVLITAVFAFVVFHSINITSTQMSSTTPDEISFGTMQADSQRRDLGMYLSKIQPIFDQRCIACHSCYNSPCQLDLTSYQGLTRGAHKRNIYDFPKFTEASPTRLGIDAKSSEEWEKKFNFFSVLKSNIRTAPENLSTSTLSTLVNMRRRSFDDSRNGSEYVYNSEKSRFCPNGQESFDNLDGTNVLTELESYTDNFKFAGMPYGFPSLKDSELEAIQVWLSAGAPAPTLETMKAISAPGVYQRQVIATESFFNRNEFKARLTARYIFEHLFLAHIYFDESEDGHQRPSAFFRLIRAENREGWPIEIPTVRPMDDPKQKFFYRLKKYTGTVVHKNHLPYLINSKKLEKWQKQFIQSKWLKSDEELSKEGFPTYGKEGFNPFATFHLIPAEARARFMLDDAHYHTMAFIKGPVCNGQVAVSVIDDNFWVMFVDPKNDISVIDPDFLPKNVKRLALPAVSSILQLKDVLLAKVRANHQLVNQDKYSRYKGRYPHGFDLNLIWDGTNQNGVGENPNALLTVYRHNDSATVLKGAHGQTPKTVWLLDYPLFEDIYYNLVADYNVFGPFPHQLATRRYMDHSRIDAQDLFINLLPLSQREAVRNTWSQDPPSAQSSPDEVKRRMEDRFPNEGKTNLTAISLEGFQSSGDHVASLLSLIFSTRIKSKVRGPIDQINNTHERLILKLTEEIRLSEVERVFSSIAGRAGTFAVPLPDACYVRVRFQNGTAKLYTMIHNREHYAVNFVFGEEKYFRPELDSINFIPGIAASYPNLYFDLEESEVKDFVAKIKELDGSPKSLANLLRNYAILRSSEKFWNFNDWVTQKSIELNPVEGGPLDLSRYVPDM